MSHHRQLRKETLHIESIMSMVHVLVGKRARNVVPYAKHLAILPLTAITEQISLMTDKNCIIAEFIACPRIPYGCISRKSRAWTWRILRGIWW